MVEFIKDAFVWWCSIGDAFLERGGLGGILAIFVVWFSITGAAIMSVIYALCAVVEWVTKGVKMVAQAFKEAYRKVYLEVQDRS